jgi:uncharacterized protein YdeI (YjbR/CyaY-like superfamily)
MKPVHFKSAAKFRDWLADQGETASELLVGLYKKGSGKGGITYREALDEALCFGWIDGVRRSLDQNSYSIRFTPRRTRSVWSRVNIKRAVELKELGRMRSTGLKAFDARTPERSGIYSFENSPRKLEGRYAKEFKVNKTAWTFFQTRAPWYRRTASFWVMSAKKEETRRRRLATLIADSAQGRPIGPLRRPVPIAHQPHVSEKTIEEAPEIQRDLMSCANRQPILDIKARPVPLTCGFGIAETP